MARLRRLVASFSQQRPGFNPSPFLVRFMADKVITGTGLSPFISLFSYQYHSTNFPLTSSSQALVLIRRTSGRILRIFEWSSALGDTVEHWTGRSLHFSSCLHSFNEVINILGSSSFNMPSELLWSCSDKKPFTHLWAKDSAARNPFWKG